MGIRDRIWQALKSLKENQFPKECGGLYYKIKLNPSESDEWLEETPRSLSITCLEAGWLELNEEFLGFQGEAIIVKMKR